MNSGRKTVATAGKPERLSEMSMTAEWLEIEALVSNATTSAVYVGGPNVYALSGGEIGTRLVTDGTRGDRMAFEKVNLSEVYIDAQNDGEGVSYSYG